jgi:hypothetical protein
VPSVELDDLSWKQADEFRAAVVAEEPGRLGELSSWLRATDGPSGTVTDDPLAYLLGTDDALTILKGRDEDLNDPRRLAPLDGRLIDQHLSTHGLHRAGTSAQDGLQIQTWVLDGDVLLASVDVVSVDAAVRYVYAHFEGDLHYRRPGFRRAATVFVTLAQRLGAGFLDDQFGILRPR